MTKKLVHFLSPKMCSFSVPAIKNVIAGTENEHNFGFRKWIKFLVIFWFSWARFLGSRGRADPENEREFGSFSDPLRSRFSALRAATPPPAGAAGPGGVGAGSAPLIRCSGGPDAGFELGRAAGPLQSLV